MHLNEAPQAVNGLQLMRGPACSERFAADEGPAGCERFAADDGPGMQ